MVAGALLLAVVWVFLLRYVPEIRRSAAGPVRPRPLRPRAPPSLPKAADHAGVPARVRPPGRVAPRRPDARPADPHHRRHPPGRDRIALPPDPAGGPQRRVPRARRRLRRHARAARGAGRRAAAVRRQRLPRAAHPAGDHADAARRRPQRSEPRQRRARRAPPRRQHPGDRPHRGAAPAQPRRPAVLRPRARRPVPDRRGGHRDAPPVRGEARRHHRDLRRRGPHHRLARAAAADDHEPRAQRDRPQPARAGHRVGHDQRSPRGAWCSRSRTPASSSPRSWSRRSPSRSSAAPSASAPTTPGVGLGLAIVKSITQAHDGTLTLTPRDAGGLCVTVQLPAAPPQTGS